MNFKAWISRISGDFADFLPILFCCTVQYFAQWSNSVFIAINGFLSQINWSKVYPGICTSYSRVWSPKNNLHRILQWFSFKNLTGPVCISAYWPRWSRDISVPIFTRFYAVCSGEQNLQNLSAQIFNVVCKNVTGPDCVSAACPRWYRISSVPVFTEN